MHKKRLINKSTNLYAFIQSLKVLIENEQNSAINCLDKDSTIAILNFLKKTGFTKELFCTETIYTLFNEIILLWVSRDKKLLFFEEIKDYKNFNSLKTKTQNIYSHIFKNNIFDLYKPSEVFFNKVNQLFNNYDFTNTDKDLIGKLYEQFIDKEERKRLGQFYTPEVVIDYILDKIGYTANNKIENKKIIDISCGSGGFLVRAARRLISNLEKKQLSPKKIIETTINNIYGLDINPFACYLAETNLLLQLLDYIIELRSKKDNLNYQVPKINIYQTNSIEFYGMFGDQNSVVSDIKNRRGKFQDGFDFVVGNPPYLEAKKMDQNTKKLCIESCKEVLKGAFDLYICFIYLGLKYLNKNGNFGYIIPNKFLIANYSIKIRKLILTNYSIKEIVDMSKAKVFDDASVYPIILIVNNKKPKRDTTLLTSSEIKEPKKLISNEIKLHKIKQKIYERDDYIFFTLPNSETQANLLLKLINGYKTLDTYLEIKWTVSFHSLGLRENFLFDHKPSSRYAKKLIGGKSFGGNSEVDRYRLMWKDWWIDYDREKARRLNNGLPSETLFEREKIVICQNALRLRATYDENNYYFKDTFFVAYLREGIKKNRIVLKYLLAILNSKLMHYVYSNLYHGTRVAGGYLHYLVNYLYGLPIAETNIKEQKEIITLVDKILITRDEKTFNKLDMQIDKRINQIYNLNTEEIKIIESFREN